VLDALGGTRRPAVSVTLNGFTYRTTIGSMKGVAKIPVSAAVRAAAHLEAGDAVTVELAVDTSPRAVEVPADFAEALAGSPAARAFFAGLSPSRQKAYVTRILEANQPETRARRVAGAVERLTRGQASW
jgi:uncharacterized protein YdeI (YjbR/CyaY-like superfamily)